MDYSSFAEYMENIALKHKHIDHSSNKDFEKGFFMYEKEDLINGQLSKTPPGDSITIMYILPYGVNYNSASALGVVYSKDPSYMILVRVQDYNDAIKVAAAMTKAEAICHQINKKIKSDCDEGLFVAELDYDNIDMNPILRFHDSLYGFQVFLPFDVSDDLCVEDDVWMEVTDPIENNDDNEEIQQ